MVDLANTHLHLTRLIHLGGGQETGIVTPPPLGYVNATWRMCLDLHSRVEASSGPLAAREPNSHARDRVFRFSRTTQAGPKA